MNSLALNNRFLSKDIVAESLYLMRCPLFMEWTQCILMRDLVGGRKEVLLAISPGDDSDALTLIKRHSPPSIFSFFLERREGIQCCVFFDFSSLDVPVCA